MSRETWKHIPGFPDHAVSNHGRVISLGRTLAYGRKLRSRLLTIREGGYVALPIPPANKGHRLLSVRKLVRELHGVDVKVEPMQGRYLE